MPICATATVLAALISTALPGGDSCPPGGPANNCSVNATPMSPGQSLGFDTSTASTDGPPNFQCSYGKDVWYLIQAPADGEWSITVDTPSFDSTVAVYYLGMSPDFDPADLPLFFTGCVNGPGPGGESFDFPGVAGVYYLLQVAGFQSGPVAQSGPGIISVHFPVSPSGPPLACETCCAKTPSVSTFGGKPVVLGTDSGDQVVSPPSPFVLHVFDVSGFASQSPGVWAPPRYEHASWTQDILGSVFGVTADDNGNIYLSHFVPYFVYSLGTLGGTSGAVTRIDGTSGTPTVLVNLPQSAPNGPGLGNLTWSCTYQSLHVTNFEDGRVYRIDPSAPAGSRIKSAWDFATDTLDLSGNPEPGDPLGIAPLGERVWAVAVGDGKMFVSLWNRDLLNPGVGNNAIWSVHLNSLGDPIPGTRVLEIDLGLPIKQTPVADLAFDANCCLYAAQRSMHGTQTTAHDSDLLRFCFTDESPGGPSWQSSGVFSVGMVPTYPNSTAGGVGVDSGSGGRVWATGDYLLNTPELIYGIQGLPQTGGDTLNSFLIDMDGNIPASSKYDKTLQGSCEVICTSSEGTSCEIPPASGPPFLLLGRDQLCGDLMASGGHNSIAAIGLINNPSGYVSVGSRALPSGQQGLHLVRWSRAGDIVVERLFRTDNPSETIIGTSVEVGENCILVGGRTQSASGPSTFVARFDIDLNPIWGPTATAGARRVPGNNNGGTNPQADWLSNGSIVVCGMDGPGASPAFGHVACLTALGGQIWSKRYQSFWGTPNPRFIVEDVEQDPVGGSIWTCGGMEYPITPTTYGIVPMIAEIDLTTGALVASYAYPFPPGSTWTQGRYRAIRFNPTIGPRDGDIVVAGSCSKPGGPFDPFVVAARVGLLDRSPTSPVQHWDSVYPGVQMVPGTSAISIAPQLYAYPNQIVVAGGTVGGFGEALVSGHTLRTAEADGAFVSAQRHGFPDIPDKTYGFRDITRGGYRVMMGVMTEIAAFPAGGSRFWFSRGVCPTPYSSGVEDVTHEFSQVGSEVGTFDDIIVPMGLVEVPVVSPCVVLCQESIGWGEPFDDADLPGPISPEGLWEPWDGNPEWATAEVTSDFSRSAPHSLAVDLQDDVVRQFGFVGGQWRFTAWQYVPGDFVGESFLTLLNNYVHGGPYSASVQLGADGTAEVIEDINSGDTLPLIRDQWVEIRLDINLDADTVSVYYGGRLLVTKNWQDAAGGGKPLPAIGAVDLFGNGASPVYYDDFSLVPANLCPGDLNGDCLVNGADLGLLLGAWGPCSGCPADMNGDGVVNGADLGLLLGNWG